MLDEKIKGFIAYCKVAGFRDKSIETLSLRLNEFNRFLKSKRFKNLQSAPIAIFPDSLPIIIPHLFT